MSTVLMSPGQKSVEERYEQIKNIPVNPDKSAGEQFGEMDSWMFTLGEYRMFLNPMTRRWYFFDRVHNYWKDINAPAGTVIFSLRGSDLDIIKTSADLPGASPAVPAAGQVHRFCPQCGAPLKPGLKFCSSCGTKIS
ncbi:MAG: zinc ribbon domain-containing protein [Methanoregula sp.]